jgi:hypothetical protein
MNGNDPISNLRFIIESKRQRLTRYNANNPEVNTEKGWKELNELDDICSRLENATRIIPLSIFERVNEGVLQAAAHEFKANCAEVWIPLSDNVTLDNARPCIIDLCDFRYTENGIEVRPMDAHDYNHIGFRSGKLYKSLKEMEANHG